MRYFGASLQRMLRTTLYFILASVIISFVGMTSLTGCKKPLLYSKSNLTFSKDTVVFDTIFTTIGSTTQSFKFYNPENRALKVDQIELMGGVNSPFRLNVDGVPGTFISDIEIEGKDSLFVFVDVTLEVNNALNPMIIEDSIRFRTNGVDQYVHLAVWGQDAYFHYKDVNTGTWPNDKPHVIFGYAAVDSAETLIIPAGTDIFLHKNALLINYKGTLEIQGELGNEVTLQGDRLEPLYEDVSGQYYGIYFQQARPSKINYCNIKNGTAGIHVFSADPSNPPGSNTVEITNTKITNCARYGLFLFTEELNPNARVMAENSIFAKNDVFSFFVLGGADYHLNHCHILGYGGGQQPAVGITNVYTNQNTGTQTIGRVDEGRITNSVIYGTLDCELGLDTNSYNNSVPLNFFFENNLIKCDPEPVSPLYDPSFNNVWNMDPQFYDITNDDFFFFSTSPLNNTASPTYPTSNGLDINGTTRNVIADKGAYEQL